MTSPTILVTGATGTTGGAIVRQLSAAGIAARALTRDPARAKSLANISFVAGDLADPASLATTFAGIEAVYLNVVPGPDALLQIDNAIAAAKAVGVTRIVKLSGLNATPQSPSAIIRMHVEADSRVRASGIGYTILRANSFFQNIEGQLATVKVAGKFYLPLGDARQSLIDVEDIAAVAVIALTGKTLRNRDLDLTGPAALNFHDVASALSNAFGKPVSYVPISNEAFAEALRGNGVPAPAAASVAELFGVFASGVYAAPTHDVEHVLGRPPRSITDYAATLV
jgi:uncharacterized protein YbjT (DUF2867 family)